MSVQQRKHQEQTRTDNNNNSSSSNKQIGNTQQPTTASNQWATPIMAWDREPSLSPVPLQHHFHVDIIAGVTSLLDLT